MMLGFQRQASMAAIMRALVTGKIHMLAGIHLHARLGGAQVHHAAALRIIQRPKAAHAAARYGKVEIIAIFCHHHGILAAAGKPLAQAQPGAEIYRQAVHGQIVAGGDQRVVRLGNERRVQRQNLPLDIALTGQIEIGMVGQVAQGILIAHGAVANAQVVFMRPANAQRHPQRAGKALLAVRAGIGKGDHISRLALVRLGMPKLAVKAVMPAVQAVGAFVCIQMIILAVQGKGGAGDAVAYAANGRADIVILADIIGGAVKAQRHIGQVARAIRHTHSHDARAIIGQAQLRAGRIGQGKKRGGAAIGQRAKGRNRNAHVYTS